MNDWPGLAFASLLLLVGGCTAVRPPAELDIAKSAPSTGVRTATHFKVEDGDRSVDVPSGVWQPVEGANVSPADRLVIEDATFSWVTACGEARGDLHRLLAGRYSVQNYFSAGRACGDQTVIALFDGTAQQIVMLDEDTLRIDNGNDFWIFQRSSANAKTGAEAFAMGEWLLADDAGRPYRGSELTRVSFGARYFVDAENCDFAATAWSFAPDGRIGIDRTARRLTKACREVTLGDRLAVLGRDAVYVADRVETRLNIDIGGERATLVRAERYPELTRGAQKIPPHPWAMLLAEKAAGMTVGERARFALRAIGLGDEGLPEVQAPADTRSLAFTGLNEWHYRQGQLAGLLSEPGSASLGLADALAIAPRVVLAKFEGVEAVDRGDGLALDYNYRIVESWRGGGEPGELLIVRMPPLAGKSRSPIITPEVGAEVLLLASRTGYLAGVLVNGLPPSLDRRVVQMTLPLMRIVDGRLVEALEGANVLGAAEYAGTTVDEARDLARSIELRMTEASLIRPLDGWGNPIVKQYFITQIGDRELEDPTRLWVAYEDGKDLGNPNGLGGVVAYYDGCTPVYISRQNGKNSAFANAVACPGKLPNGHPVTEPVVAEVVAWISAHHFPHVLCVADCPTSPPYIVPLSSGDVILRAVLR